MLEIDLSWLPPPVKELLKNTPKRKVVVATFKRGEEIVGSTYGISEENLYKNMGVIVGFFEGIRFDTQGKGNVFYESVEEVPLPLGKIVVDRKQIGSQLDKDIEDLITNAFK